MAISNSRKLSFEDKGLRYKLLIIEGLIFVLPFFLLSYIHYQSNIRFEFSQQIIFVLTLFIILTGLIILRKVFDNLLKVGNLITNAAIENDCLTDIQKDTSELQKIIVSFNNLFKKNQETTDKLRRRVFELFAVKELIEVSSKSLDFDDLLKLLLEKTMAVTKAKIGSVFMVESEKNRFRVITAKGMESGPKKGACIKINASLARLVVAKKKPLLVKNIETDSRIRKPNDPKYGSGSFLSMPIFVRDDLLSVLNLSNKETGKAFNADDQEILSIMIGEIGFALENAQLHLRAKENIKTLKKLTEDQIKTNDKLQQEVAKRKLSEATLYERENLYRDLFENASDLILNVSLNGRFLQVNEKWRTMLGYGEEDLPALSMWDIIHPDSLANCKRIFQNILSGETVNNIDTVFISKNGKPIPVEGNASCRFENGKPVAVWSIFRDMTERIKAEESLLEYSQDLERMVEERTIKLNNALNGAEEARDRIDGILKSVADGLIVTGTNNRIILMNRAAEDLLGVRFSEVIDQSIDFVIKDEILREQVKNTLNKKKNGYEFDFELQEDDQAHPQIMRARTSVIHDKEGRQSGIVTIIHDVTHEREVDRMKTEFISTAAHELRTPLTSIMGFSEILLTRDDIKAKEKVECLSYINEQSMNLSAIIDDLLDISRIESGAGFSLNKVSADITDIIKDTVPYFQTQSEKHSFEVVVSEEPVEVMVDKAKIRQVLANLLSNAVKYSSEGGMIRIVGEPLQDRYQVCIEDQGVGMSPEQMEKIFDKFYRADASNTGIPGTGLGMNIVNYLVKAHGGEVRVESELGKGTMVRFTIPVKGVESKDNLQAAISN